MCMFVCVCVCVCVCVYACVCMLFTSTHTDDGNRIVLQPLSDRLSTDTDYVNAYAGDYINASYIDVSSLPIHCTTCGIRQKECNTNKNLCTAF